MEQRFDMECIKRSLGKKVGTTGSKHRLRLLTLSNIEHLWSEMNFKKVKGEEEQDRHRPSLFFMETTEKKEEKAVVRRPKGCGSS